MLPSGPAFVAFVAASLVVLLVPGPGVMYVVTRSATQGIGAGLASVAGLAGGAMVHAIAVTVGLSALLLASATAFTVVKLIGAGYLIYLGITTLLSRSPLLRQGDLPPTSNARLVLDGVLISVFNPKIAVFFLAYLPQFVNPDGPIPTQLFLLGMIYVLLSVITDGGYALMADRISRWVRHRTSLGPVPRVATGMIYIGLGVSTALTGRQGDR